MASLNNHLINVLRPSSPNKLLKELVFADHTSEELDNLQQDALESVQIKDLFYTSYLSLDNSASVGHFIIELTKAIVDESRRYIHKTLKEHSSSSEDELEKLIMRNVVFDMMNITHEKTKASVWLWKQGITISLLEEIEKAAKSDIDIVFQLARDEKDVWKRAFERQPDIQPIRIEYTESAMTKMMDKELVDVDIADTEQLQILFLRLFLEVEKNLLIANIVVQVCKRLGVL